MVVGASSPRRPAGVTLGGTAGLPDRVDAVVVGAGHNGLVAACVLARAGRSVLVLERDEVMGGACRTERPFQRAPALGTSTGAYLLGLMPPEILTDLDLRRPLVRRDPYGFLPTLETGRYLMLGADAAANRAAVEAFSGRADARALEAMGSELSALRDDLAPAWLNPPLSVEGTAERFVRPQLRQAFVELVTGSVGDYLARFEFASELLPAMLAATDAFPGLHGGWDTPGSGANFLVHNMGRLPGADGTWMLVRGGMGTVTTTLAERARQFGAAIVTQAPVDEVVVSHGIVEGVRVGDRLVAAPLVLINADPLRLRDLVPSKALGASAEAAITRAAERPGTTVKVNLALRALPRFSCLPEQVGQHRATIHLLPDLDDPVGALRLAWAEVQAGRIPNRPPIEIYLHTAADPSLQDPEGRHSGALFVQWVPNRLRESSWDEEGEALADQLLAQVDAYAPGTSALVVDREVLHPEAIERSFGITGGNIFHLDNTVAFDRRMPYRLAADGLFACGAACHPAGSVIGAAGYNAAHLALDAHGGD